MAYNLASAVINSNSAGDNLVIAAVTGRRIRVWGIDFTSGSAATITMYSDAQATGTALSGAFSLAVNGALSLGTPVSSNNMYLWETAQGKAFNMYTSTGTQMSGNIYYQVI